MPLRLPQTAILRPARPLQPLTTRLFSAEATIKFDQTKKSNDPNGQPRDGEGGNGSSGAQPQPHPAKEPDPQEAPSKSTGVRGEGPDGRAGEGKAAGRVHKGDKEAVDGAKQHSVKRPIPGDGNTSEGRGGDAL